MTELNDRLVVDDREYIRGVLKISGEYKFVWICTDDAFPPITYDISKVKCVDYCAISKVYIWELRENDDDNSKSN